MRRFLVVSLKQMNVRRLQFRLRQARVARAQALVLANVLKRSLMVAQVDLYPSAILPTMVKIGVYCESSPSTCCAQIQLTSEICKNKTAPAQYCFVHLVQFHAIPCKTDSLSSLLRDICHPQVLFSDSVDHSSHCISRSESLIQFYGTAEVGQRCVGTRLCVNLAPDNISSLGGQTVPPCQRCTLLPGVRPCVGYLPCTAEPLRLPVNRPLRERCACNCRPRSFRPHPA